MSDRPPGPAARVAKAGRRPLVLVCGKCLKRHEDGKALRRALKDEGRERGKPRLVRSACLGLCPKRAVVLASAATLARGEVVLAAAPEDAAPALATLLPAERA